MQAKRHYKYYDLLLAAFVTALLCSNLIGAGKAAVVDLPILGMTVFGAGILFFPITYLFGDILTEVYGYGHDRRAVWAGFAALLFAAFMSVVVIQLPPADNDYMRQYQIGLETVFGNTWRIIAASMLAFWCGSLANAYVMAKMKILTQGQHLWMRTIGSTAVGEAIDSSIFYFMAFYAIWPTEQVIAVALAQYVLKTSWEILMTPVTYRVIAWLKRKESEDYYDYHTNFTPFRLKV
ncbi:queuosine precursor transporter [Polynucleobacter sp. MWH-Loch1C5]|uniref:queuosine precursor transporter n=1 Tax=Polynucleobacter sp. MWH-Loch1C5 TaxID=2689108 RepID=UPI001C0C96DD|nr:queuosine precursor transporter [Polynucleobacter sp. MWH-Loch1C5]MBU3543093.1 queuosine precursor transporter [Polynucleobacter sp. MWH-Loch1C5]